MHDGIDAVALEPPVTERAGVAKRLVGAAFGEPRVLRSSRSSMVIRWRCRGQLRHGWPADMQQAAGVVVQFDGEMQAPAAGNHPLQPPLERGVFRCQIGVGRLVPVPFRSFPLPLKRVIPRATPSLFAIGRMYTVYR